VYLAPATSFTSCPTLKDAVGTEGFSSSTTGGFG
jgi:hypothetical protein